MKIRISKSRFVKAYLPVVFSLCFVAGCGGGSGAPVRSSFVEFSQEQKLQIEMESARPYRIQTDDVLQVSVSQQKDLFNSGVLVLPDGSVSLIDAGRVPVAGYTVSEVDSMITAAYSREVKDPDVSVIVVETKGRRVYVLGEVRVPGLVELPKGGLGIVGAVALAGGFTSDAAPEGTVLVRVNDQGYLAQEVDLSDLGSIETASLATVGLHAYDVVYVPRSRLGDFGYFSKTVLSGLVSLTRMAVDIKYLTSTGSIRGF